MAHELRDRFRRVLEIAEAAMDQPETERESYVRRRCDTDPTLAAEVLTLVDERPSDGFLEPPGERDTSADEARIGSSVGDFTLERLLGRGGMGTVYAARQDRPQRTVALKVLRGEFDRESIRRRFEIESEILARLEHPAIARVLASGVLREGGGHLPYYALELVDGARHLIEWVRAEAPDQKKRLRLFQLVCDAVQHAHDKGVIHRDLKPANILVDVEGHPKLIDFGIARAGEADDSWRTRSEERGQLLGTLPYLAPELLDGSEHADVRTDVYALGVCLFELLLGEKPVDLSGLSFTAALRRLALEEPSPPTSLPTELRWILIHALAKDPERRYASARELGEDLARWCVGEAVRAAPSGAAYRFRKLVGRHRVMATAIAGLVLAFFAAFLATWLHLQREKDLRRESERNFTRSEKSAEFLFDMFRRIDADVDGLDVTVARILERAQPSIAPHFAGYPDLEATFRGHVGHAWSNLGDHEQATASFRIQAQLLEQELGDAHPSTADARTDLAQSLHASGAVEEAGALIEEVLANLRETVPDEDARLTDALQVLASVELDRGRPAEALAVQKEVVERRAREEDPRKAALSRNVLAAILVAHGDLREAIDVAEEAQRCWVELDGPDSSRALSAGNVVASSWRRLGERERAVDLFRVNLEKRREVFGPTHVKTLTVAGNLANNLIDLKRYPEAEELLLEILAAARELDVVPRGLIAPFLNYGWLLFRSERPEEAAKIFAEFLEVGGRAWPPGYWRLSDGHRGLSLALFRSGDVEGAEREILKAHEILEAEFGGADPRTQRIVRNLVGFYSQVERPEDQATWESRLVEDG